MDLPTLDHGQLWQMRQVDAMRSGAAGVASVPCWWCAGELPRCNAIGYPVCFEWWVAGLVGRAAEPLLPRGAIGRHWSSQVASVL